MTNYDLLQEENTSRVLDGFLFHFSCFLPHFYFALKVSFLGVTIDPCFLHPYIYIHMYVCVCVFHYSIPRTQHFNIQTIYHWCRKKSAPENVPSSLEKKLSKSTRVFGDKKKFLLFCTEALDKKRNC